MQHRGLGIPVHTRLCDGHIGDGGVGGHIVHDPGQQSLHHRPQTARADVPCQRGVRHRLQRVLIEMQLHTIVAEQLLVLLHQRVLRLGEDTHQILPGQPLQGGDDRHTAYQLGDDAELQQIVGLDLLEQFAGMALFFALHRILKPHAALAHPVLDDLFQTVERAAADKQDIAGIQLDELLMGVLAPALGRHIGNSALQYLQQRLLHALAGHIAGDGRILALPSDLVDLIHVDDAPLGQLYVEIRRLQKAQQYILYVVTHIAGLGQCGGIGNGKGDLQHPRQRLGKQRLAGAGRTDHQDIAFLQLHILVAAEINALVVVVHRHGQRHLGCLLPDNILVQHVVYLLGRRQLVHAVYTVGGRGVAVVQDIHAQLDALVANSDTGTLNHAMDLTLRLAAERAAQFTKVV